MRASEGATHLDADGSDERVVHVRRQVHETSLAGGLGDGRRRDDGAEREAGAESLGQREDVGHDAVALERPHVCAGHGGG